jgi:transcriptional regulator with XRE-family HTH domain
MKEWRELGERLAQARKARRWTQADLAGESGLSLSHISKIEIGASPVGDAALRVVGQVLGVRPEWLRTGKGSAEARTDYPESKSAPMMARDGPGCDVDRLAHIEARMGSMAEAIVRLSNAVERLLEEGGCGADSDHAKEAG